MLIIKKTGLYVLLTALVILFVSPLVYAVYTSLVPFADVNKLVPPSHWTLDNYKQIFQQYPVIRWFFNSVIMVTVLLIGNLATSLLAGFALAKLHFRANKWFFNLILITLMVPFQLLLTPIYVMVANLGWADSMLGITIPFLVNSLSIFMARQFYFTIPDELLDAAKMDGLGYFRTFTKIILPISSPIIITLTILNFTSSWNSYIVPVTFLSTTDNFVLTLGLNSIKAANFTQPNLTMAGVTLLSIPVLIVFMFLQRYFIQGIAATGSKE